MTRTIVTAGFPIARILQKANNQRMTSRPRHAFTMVEMLMVITIITMLFGAAAVGVNLVLKSKAKTETTALIRSLTVAIKSYEEDGFLQPAGWVNDLTASSTTSAYLYLNLVSRPQSNNKPPYIEVPKWALNGSVLTDAWGDDLVVSGIASGQTIAGTSNNSNFYNWTESGSGSKHYIQKAIIRSKAGTDDSKNKKDDVIFIYDATASGAGEWQSVTVQ